MRNRTGHVWSRAGAAVTGVALLCTSVALGAGAAGTLDTNFGEGDGLVTTAGSGAALDVVVQSAGTSERYLVAGTPWAVLAYTPTGELDTTFGAGGDGVVPLFTIDTNSPMAYDLSLDSQNRVVVGGTSTVRTVTTYDRKGRAVSTASYRGMTVARLTEDGLLDTTFNGTGIATVWAGSPDGYDETGVAAVAVPDALGGGVVAAGTCFYVQIPATKKAAAVINRRMFLAKFQDDGLLDPAFGANGIAYETCSSEPRPVGLALQSDGRIVVAERTEFTAGTSAAANNWVVSRFTAAGALDASFGTNGRVVSGGAYVSRLQVDQGTDSIVACGGGAVARYLVDGAPDMGFDGDGFAGVTGGASGTTAIAVQSDGRVVFCGQSVVDSVYYGLVGRLDSTGSPDGSFGSGGYVAPLPSGWWPQSVAEAADGIVVAGGVGSGSGEIFVGRYGK